MRLLIAAALFLAVSIPAQAAHCHHYSRFMHRCQVAHHHRTSHALHRHAGTRISRNRHSNRVFRQTPGGIVTVSTVAGKITVARSLAGRFQALIADLVAHGYKPRRIGCFARGGHVAHSRHYAGAACDFDQRGWGKTAAFMYHAHIIIARHGFRDGCSFGDCGHVDDGQPMRYAHSLNEDDDS